MWKYVVVVLLFLSITQPPVPTPTFVATTPFPIPPLPTPTFTVVPITPCAPILFVRSYITLIMR